MKSHLNNKPLVDKNTKFRMKRGGGGVLKGKKNKYRNILIIKLIM